MLLLIAQYGVLKEGNALVAVETSHLSRALISKSYLGIPGCIYQEIFIQNVNT